IRDAAVERPWVRRFRAALRLVTLLMATAATIYAFYIIGRVRAALAAGAPPKPLDKQYLFTALAILFPVVAAFCLSMARLCWQNAGRLSLASKEREKVWRRYRTAQEPYEKAQAARTTVQSRLDAMNGQEIDEMFL